MTLTDISATYISVSVSHSNSAEEVPKASSHQAEDDGQKERVVLSGYVEGEDPEPKQATGSIVQALLLAILSYWCGLQCLPHR